MRFFGFFNLRTLDKFRTALKFYVMQVLAGDALQVSISDRNNKMGAVASVSLLPYFSCHARCQKSCGGKCYAAKLANLRKSVRNAYARNTALAIYKPQEYWRQVRAAAAAFKYFRFHVSGDILNARYFAEMVKTAQELPGTEFLAFTKKYEIVNEWIDEHGALPKNLRILFSGWSNLTPDNPHGLPETTVYKHDGDFNPVWKSCGGNCFNCACSGLGCWNAVAGDIIAFKEH